MLARTEMKHRFGVMAAERALDLIRRIKNNLEVSKAKAEAKRKAALIHRSGNFTLKAETRAIIAKLKDVDWYSRVGNPTKDDRVRQVLSWEEAIALDVERDWENTTLQAANEVRHSIQAASWAEYHSWNEVVGFLKLELEPIWHHMNIASERQTNARSQYKQIRASTRWDILHWGIESEFSEFNPPGFFSQLGEWYIRGHFPCGWHGKYPGGNLIVF